MVNLGFVPPEGRIPSPDMSFARLFKENRSKWGRRGQYAIWTGSRSVGEQRYRLIERMNRNVICIEQTNGGQLMHRIAAGTEFTIEHLMGYWLKLDMDSIWIDVPSSSGQYCVLLVGGSTEAQGIASVGWPCPGCGAALVSKPFENLLRDFSLFLNGAEELVGNFNSDAALRTCRECSTVHPASYRMMQDEPVVSNL